MKAPNRRPNRLVGWRYAAFIGSFVGAILLAAYPIIISPMINPEPWKNIQAVTRKNIKQEDIQPGNMKVWTNPFEPAKKEKKADEIED